MLASPRPFVAPAAALAACALSAGCASHVTLHPPEIATSIERAAPAKVDLDPIAVRPGADRATSVDGKRARFERPNAAAAVTAGMRAEIEGRALRGGDPGGYTVRCTLDRFALRTESNVAATKVLAILYVDLACDVERSADRAPVWRGALHGRAAAEGGSTFKRDVGMMQNVADRTLADAARELASDLAVRVLGLDGVPSARVFVDDDERAASGGIDDAPTGPIALSESPANAATLVPQLRDPDRLARAAAWNAIAMAAGPGDPWPVGGALPPDDDAYVRVYQYKALARAASPATLAELHAALSKEDDARLAELARDALASGGLGLPRTKASAETNGTTTSP